MLKEKNPIILFSCLLSKKERERRRNEERGEEMERVGKGRERIYQFLFVESKEQTTHIIDGDVIATNQ
jgi:hypothetical protein